LELAGAKNQKTALATLEFYPREKKVFLLDIYDRIAGDEALLEIIAEEKPLVARMGVNVPLTLPPCMFCRRRVCPLPGKCTVFSVRWMREAARRAAKASSKARVREFTPYTQRPVELFIRYSVQPELPASGHFEVDEALGGTKGALTARMHFLRRHLGGIDIIETWPKLTVALLEARLGLNRRVVASYRQLEDGISARTEILDAISRQLGVFIYERDLQKLARNLASFDAFACAYTALLSDNGQCVKLPPGFPAASGWIEFPQPGGA